MAFTLRTEQARSTNLKAWDFGNNLHSRFLEFYDNYNEKKHNFFLYIPCIAPLSFSEQNSTKMYHLMLWYTLFILKLAENVLFCGGKTSILSHITA